MYEVRRSAITNVTCHHWAWALALWQGGSFLPTSRRLILEFTSYVRNYFTGPRAFTCSSTRHNKAGSVLRTKYYVDDEIKENAIGGSRCTYTGGEVMRAGCWCGYMKEKDYLEELSTGGKIILKWIGKKLSWKLWAWLKQVRIGTTFGLL
jgi:hypothetical protein